MKNYKSIQKLINKYSDFFNTNTIQEENEFGYNYLIIEIENNKPVYYIANKKKF